MESENTALVSREGEMFAHIRKQSESRLTPKAYCEKAGISKSTFSYWLRRYRGSKKSGGFVELESAADITPGEIHIRLGAGVEISIRL